MMQKMSENNDPTIKLFGKTIHLGSNSKEDSVIASRIEPSAAADRADVDCECTTSDQSLHCSKQDENRGDENSSTREPMDTNQEDEPSSSSVVDESRTPPSPSTNPQNPNSKNQDRQKTQTSSTTNSQDDQNPPKKPDKIIPCPRCNSMETKFCYFNNYNVNQPRHFCKNCQRYWTAGGTMRNVPVGAGRRKSKSSTSSSSSSSLASVQIHHHGLNPNSSSVLTFSPNSPLPRSMASTLELMEKSSNLVTNENQNLNPIPYTWNPIPWQPTFYTTTSPSPWNLHFLPTPAISLDQSSSNSSPNSPSLGKHPRDNGLIFIPKKTLRIDDPNEAAKSSIWTTLKTKNDRKGGGSSNGEGFFRGLHQFKVGDYDHNHHPNGDGEASPLVLQANPAAFFRSSSFHEDAQ